MRSPSLIVLAAFAVACAEPAPPTPVIRLTQTGDTLVAPVALFSEAELLSDGRWVMIAPVELQVQVVNFADSTVRPFPNMSTAEVPGPSTLLAAADTVMVGDWGLQRVTGWLTGESRLFAIPMPGEVSGALPRARDAAGQWFFEASVPAGRDGSGLADSGMVVRGDPLLARFDTVARLAPPDLAVMQREGGQRYERRVLSGQDRWGVLRDGTLWLARFRQNRVEWRRPDGTVIAMTKPLPDPILAVTEMDRQIYLQRFPEEQRQAARGQSFVELKPAFEAAFATPDRRVWLFKSAPALDSIRTFQVVDTTGLQLVVEVPSRGYAIAVTADWILMGEQFPEGTRLLRYPVPPAARGN